MRPVNLLTILICHFVILEAKKKQCISKSDVDSDDASDNNITCSGALSIARGLKLNTSLTKLHLNVKLDIKKIITAKKILFEDKGCNDLDGIIIGALLTKDIPLTKLSLSDNQISCNGAVQIAEALGGPKQRRDQADLILELEKSRGTKELRADCCIETGDYGIAAEIRQKITEDEERIKKEKEKFKQMQQGNLKTLLLNKNDIGDMGANRLFYSLKSNTVLTHLELNDNKIEDSGVFEVSSCLTINTVLTYLSITGNKLSDRGAIEFANVVDCNSTLTELHLSDNFIGDQGATALGEALMNNSVLYSLSLDSNDIGDSGAIAISGGLKNHPTLVCMNISCNQFTDKGLKILETVKNERNVSTKYGKFWRKQN